MADEDVQVEEEEAAKPIKKAANSSPPKKSNKAKAEAPEIPFTGVTEDQIQPNSPIRQRGV